MQYQIKDSNWLDLLIRADSRRETLISKDIQMEEDRIQNMPMRKRVDFQKNHTQKVIVIGKRVLYYRAVLENLRTMWVCEVCNGTKSNSRGEFHGDLHVQEVGLAAWDAEDHNGWVEIVPICHECKSGEVFNCIGCHQVYPVELEGSQRDACRQCSDRKACGYAFEPYE